MTRIFILLPNSTRLPTIWFCHLRSYYSTCLEIPQFHNFLSAPYSYTYATILLLFQFSLRPHTTIYTLPLPISYLSLHHHTTISTLLLQNPLELHPHHSTVTTFPYPNLLYITSFIVQYFVYWFYLLCTSLYIFTIWRDFYLIISPRSGEQFYVP